MSIKVSILRSNPTLLYAPMLQRLGGLDDSQFVFRQKLLSSAAVDKTTRTCAGAASRQQSTSVALSALWNYGEQRLPCSTRSS